MNRKQRRAAAKTAKRAGNDDLEKKILMLNKLKDTCRVCSKEFDKKDEKMLSEWTVVVREKEEKVHLYCPECWQKAQSIVKDLAEEKIENSA